MTGAAVSIRGLVKRYRQTVAVDGLDLEIPVGQVCAVLGPNGAGKTTTIETCEGYRSPDEGTVDVLGLDPIRDAVALKPRVGVMLQDGGVYPAMHAEEALRHAAALYANPVPPSELAERLGLTASLRTPYRRMSGGQQRRLTLALAVIGRPELVFLDEPTAGLDPQARRATWDLITELREQGATVVVTTHLMDEAESLADLVYVIDHGRVISSGSVAALTGAQESVRFTAPAGLDRVAIANVLPTGCAVLEEPVGQYVVTGPIDTYAIAALTAWCAQQGVMPEGLSLGRRSLEDVFLELTGRELRA
jgi:ABC-2 type transport system ATP-binding protein